MRYSTSSVAYMLTWAHMPAVCRNTIIARHQNTVISKFITWRPWAVASNEASQSYSTTKDLKVIHSVGLGLIYSQVILPLWLLVGVSLSKPHTSRKNGASIAFAKIYMEIQINGTNIMRSQNFMFKNWLITYKCFQMCVHHTSDNQSSFLKLHIRLVRTFITQRIITVVYWHL